MTTSKGIFETAVSLASGSAKDSYSEVESIENVQEMLVKQQRFIPPEDFSLPQKFAKFGSAELYYDSAIKRVYNEYPYDGTAAEKAAFENKSFYVERHLFNTLYPRTNGYALFSAKGFGTLSGTISSDGYGTPVSATVENITFKGGPHTASDGMGDLSKKFEHSNEYDADIYGSMGLPSDYGKGTRTSNLFASGGHGVTVEFWLKKPSFDLTKTKKEVVFDLWNNQISSSDSYGRLRIELDGDWHGSSGGSGDIDSTPFMITFLSGATATRRGLLNERIGENVTSASLATWGHYAFSFYNSGSALITKLYVNGVLNHESSSADRSLGSITTHGMRAAIGSLVTSPSASTAVEYSGKLSASMDEFRYWKAVRNSRQISTNYFVPVHGGTNDDIANTTLGVYYKFNEGVTQTSSTDRVVLDYSGRLSNGYWNGYVGIHARSTSSAIVESSASTSEFKDPIIRSNHPEIVSFHSAMLATGSNHDHGNSSLIYHSMPQWIVDEDDRTGNNELKKMCHIVGSYFDTLYLQIKSLAAINNTTYLSSSFKAFPFNRTALEGKGLQVPELFIDADILERFSQRNDTSNYSLDLQEVKNLIYQNLHSNITQIYKSKGTEKAIRNVFRAFGIGDELIKINLYSNNETFLIEDNIQHQTTKKKYVNFNHKDNTSAVVYQYYDPTNINSTGTISGSGPNQYEKTLGFTVESNVIFPKFTMEFHEEYFHRNFTTVSLFGMHRANASGAAGYLDITPYDTPDITNASTHTRDFSNFQVYFKRDKANSKNGYFELSSSEPFPFATLTSSMFLDVYENEPWQLSVTVRPQRSKEAAVVFGSTAVNDGYDVVFAGYNKVAGTTQNSFYVTGTMDGTAGGTGELFLNSHKRLYLGAKRQNITGALSHSCDVRMSEVRYWAYALDDVEIERHAVDVDNTGLTDPLRSIGNLDSNFDDKDIRKIDTLALHWNFNNVTASDSSGEFMVVDASSGSLATSSARIDGDDNWFGNVVGFQHTGKGYGFGASATSSISYEFVNNAKYRHFEQIISSDMINILDSDDTTFGEEQLPINYHLAVEKSMYDVISQEMLNMFAGIVDFNNLIGHPVHRYREDYKGIRKLRQIFFEKVGNTPDIDRYLDFYKWLDVAVSRIIEQLSPATADTSPDMYNVVESHALERNKYKTKFPTIEFKGSEPEGTTRGREEADFMWEFESSELPASPRNTKKSSLFWKRRANRITAIEISKSGHPSVMTQLNSDREQIRKVAHSLPHNSRSVERLTDAAGTVYTVDTYPLRRFSRLYSFKVQNPVETTIHGGVNFEPNKRIDYLYNATYPHGPVEVMSPECAGLSPGRCRIPVNVLLGLSENYQSYTEVEDVFDPNKKKKLHIKVMQGRDYGDLNDHQHAKSNLLFPLNLVSGTVESGYNSTISASMNSNVIVTNIHNDVYGPDMERPMQGTFTEYAVGGHQSRHISLNTGAVDTNRTRPEAWRLLFGRCDHEEDGTELHKGAIGYVGADYPILENVEYGTYSSVDDIYPNNKGKPQPRATYYREETAKRPVNIRNIEMRTGSTILGNYSHGYEVVQAHGRRTQRRYLRHTPSASQLKIGRVDSDAMRLLETTNLLGWHAWDPLRADQGGRGNTFGGNQVYALSSRYAIQPHGNIQETIQHTRSEGIIVSRFRAPGGPEVMSPGYLDVVAGEYSVWNSLNYRNWALRGSGSGECIGELGDQLDTTDYRSIRLLNYTATSSEDTRLQTRYGLRTLLTRHAGKFYTDSQYDEMQNRSANLVEYDVFTPSFHKTHRNPLMRIELNGDDWKANVDPDNLGGVTTGSVYDNGWISHAIPRSDMQYSWITASVKNINGGYADIGQPWYGYIPANGVVNASFPQELVIQTAGFSSLFTVANVTQEDTTNDNYVKELTVLTYLGGSTRWVSISDGHHKVIFEFDTDGAVVTGRTLVDMDGISSDADAAAELKTAIEASILNVTVARSSNILTITNRQRKRYPINPYNFMSQSEIGATVISPTNKYAFVDETHDNLSDAGYGSSALKTDAFIPVDFVGLNTLVLDHITASEEGGLLLGLPGDAGKAYNAASTANALHSPYVNRLFLIGGVSASSNDQYLILGQNVSGRVPGEAPGNITNALLTNRNGPYGWPSWKQWRGGEHQLMRHNRKHNYHWTGQNRGGIGFGHNSPGTRHHIAPVSSKYHPIKAWTLYKDRGKESNVEIAATHLNDKIYFENDYQDSQFYVNKNRINSPWQALASVFKAKNSYAEPVVVKYKEVIFPSGDNMYSTSSRSRPGYVNNFWRDSHEDRITLGKAFPNSQGQTARVPMVHNGTIHPSGAVIHLSGAGVNLTRSSWPLDAGLNFLTRHSVDWHGPNWLQHSGGTDITGTMHIQFKHPASASDAATTGYLNHVDSHITELNGVTFYQYLTASHHDGEGELQNTYTQVHYGHTLLNNDGVGSGKSLPVWTTINPTALYARKHTLGAFDSVVARTGITIAETASNLIQTQLLFLLGTTDFGGNISLFGGEAQWQAGQLAGILTTSKSVDQNTNETDYVTVFESHPSSPWYDTYSEFISDGRAAAKDFSVLPEFRISEHILDMENIGKHDIISMNLGTSSANATNTTDFYKIYSHSDFLRDFEGITEDTEGMLRPLKLTLRAQAYMKFNPYNGFYPVQRTLDLVSQFSKSYGKFISTTASSVPDKGIGELLLPGSQATVTSSYQFDVIASASYLEATSSKQIGETKPNLARPLYNTLFSPGILYNTIKSGIAVDYPIMYAEESGSNEQGKMTSTKKEGWRKTQMAGTLLGILDRSTYHVLSGSVWDDRIPFEAIIYPETWLKGKRVADLEPNPSCSLPSASSELVGQSDATYSRMMRNFLAGVADFYLPYGQYTTIRSSPQTTVTVKSGSIYGARIRMYRSLNKPRNYKKDRWGGIYSADSAHNGLVAPIGLQFTRTGASGAFGSYPIPQDPAKDPGLEETFTMYSRPTAFGPPCAGRWTESWYEGDEYDSAGGGVTKAIYCMGADLLGTAVVNSWIYGTPFDWGNASKDAIGGFVSGSLDSFKGYNWSFTPPYYHGEAWCDIIFKPSKANYTMRELIQSCDVRYWRADCGPTGSVPMGFSSSAGGKVGAGGISMHSANSTTWYTGSLLIPCHQTWPGIRQYYAGGYINTNAMQLSASFNLFGVSESPASTTNMATGIPSYHSPIHATDGGQGGAQRWIIQPKFETPMLNFSSTGVRGLESSSIDGGGIHMPHYASESVPRGMWHQFGLMPDSKEKGIFLQVGDIPRRWLRNHRDVIHESTVYNDIGGSGIRSKLHRKYQSLTDLVGFDREPVRLGKIADNKTIREAIVAIPFIERRKQKMFFPLNKRIVSDEVIENHRQNRISLSVSSEVTDMLNKMERYILPPQFDFMTVPDARRVVMYIFEFEHEFDQDDLSYMWQNLAPRDSESFKITDEVTISHDLLDKSASEFLSFQDLMNPEAPVQWMVFKVKQRVMSDYKDKRIGQVPRNKLEDLIGVDAVDYWLERDDQEIDNAYSFNWPYDYFSIVEMAKISAEVNYLPSLPQSPNKITKADLEVTKRLNTNNIGTPSAMQVELADPRLLNLNTLGDDAQIRQGPVSNLAGVVNKLAGTKSIQKMVQVAPLEIKTVPKKASPGKSNIGTKKITTTKFKK